MNAKELCFKAWADMLPYVRKFRKARDYGEGETSDILWQKLPKVSKEYWLSQAST